MEIIVLNIKHNINGNDFTFSPSLLRTGEEIYLVDCGYEETFDCFIIELKKHNVLINQIKGIIISHDDIDHIGGLVKFKEYHPQIKIFCGEQEEQSISGEIKSERLLQAEKSLESLTGDYKKWALGFIETLKNVKRVKVDQTLSGGDLFKKDIEIISTPGHTKGHISLYIQSQKTLIANDAIVIENGDFEIANPIYTLDIKAAIKSVEIIKSLKPNKIVCYHGGIMDEDISEKLDKLINRYNH